MRGRSNEVPTMVPTFDSAASEDNKLLGSRNSYGILSEEETDTFEPPSLNASTRDSSSAAVSRSRWRGYHSNSTATASTGGSPASQHSKILRTTSSAISTQLEQSAVDKELNTILQKYTSRDKLKLSQILGKYTSNEAAGAQQAEERRTDETVSKNSKDRRQVDDGSAATKTDEEPREPPIPTPPTAPDPPTLSGSKVTRKKMGGKSGDGRPPIVTVVDYPTSDMVEIFGKLDSPQKGGVKQIGHVSAGEVLPSMSKDDALVAAASASIDSRSSVVQANKGLGSSNDVKSQDSFLSARSKESFASSRASRHRRIKNPKSKETTASKESTKSYGTAKSKESTINSKGSGTTLQSKSIASPVQSTNSNASIGSSKKDQLLVKTTSLEVTQKVLISPASPLTFGPPRILNRHGEPTAQLRPIVERVRTDPTVSEFAPIERLPVPIQSIHITGNEALPISQHPSQSSSDDYAALVSQSTASADASEAIPTVALSKSRSAGGSVSSRRSRGGSRRGSLRNASLSLSKSSDGGGAFGPPMETVKEVTGVSKSAMSISSSNDLSLVSSQSYGEAGSQTNVQAVTYSDADGIARKRSNGSNIEGGNTALPVSVADSDELQMQALSTIISGSASVERPVETTVSADDAACYVESATLSRVSSLPARIPSMTASQPDGEEPKSAGGTDGNITARESSIVVLSSAEDEILLKTRSKTTDEGKGDVYSSEDDIIRVQETEFGHFEEAAPPMDDMTMTADPSDAAEKSVRRPDVPLTTKTRIEGSAGNPPPVDAILPSKATPEKRKRLSSGFFGRMQRPQPADTGKPTTSAKASVTKSTKLNTRSNGDGAVTITKLEAVDVTAKDVLKVADSKTPRPTDAVVDDKTTASITLVDHRSSRKVEMIGKIIDQSTDIPSECVAGDSDTSIAPFEKTARRPLAQFLTKRFGRATKKTQPRLNNEMKKTEPVEFEGNRITKGTETVTTDNMMSKKIETIALAREDENRVDISDEGNCDLSENVDKIDDQKAVSHCASVTSEKVGSRAPLEIATETTNGAGNENVQQATILSMTDVMMAWCTPKGTTFECTGNESDDASASSVKNDSAEVNRDKQKEPFVPCSADAINLAAFGPGDAMKSMQATVMTWCSPQDGQGRFTCNVDNTASDIVGMAKRQVEAVFEGQSSEKTSLSCSDTIDVTRRSTRETFASTTAALVGWCTPRTRSSEQKSPSTQDSDNQVYTEKQVNSESYKTKEQNPASCSHGIDDTMDSTQEALSSMTSVVGHWWTPRDSAVPNEGEASSKREASNAKNANREQNDQAGIAEEYACFADVSQTFHQIEMLLPPSASTNIQGMCATRPEQSDTPPGEGQSHPTTDVAEESAKTSWTSNMINWWGSKTSATSAEAIEKNFISCVEVVADKAACVEVVDDKSIGESEDLPLVNSMDSFDNSLPVSTQPVVVVPMEPLLPTAQHRTVATKSLPDVSAPPRKGPLAGRFKKAFRIPFRSLKRPKSQVSKTVEPIPTDNQIAVPTFESIQAVAEESPKHILTPVAIVKVENEAGHVETNREIPSVTTAGDKSSVELNAIQEASRSVQEVPSSVQEVPSSVQEVPSSVQEVPSSVQGVPSSVPEALSSVNKEEQDDQNSTVGRFDDLHVTAVSESISLDEAIGEPIDYLTLVKEKREARSKRIANIVEEEELEAPLEEFENATTRQQEVSPPESVKKSHRQSVGFRRQSNHKKDKPTSKPKDKSPPSSAVNKSGSEDISSNLRVCAVSDEEVEELEMLASFATSVGSHFPPSVQSEGTETRQDNETKSTRKNTSIIRVRNPATYESVQTLKMRKNAGGKDEISMGPSANSGVGTFDDDLSGVFAPTSGGKWFW